MQSHRAFPFSRSSFIEQKALSGPCMQPHHALMFKRRFFDGQEARGQGAGSVAL